MKRKSKAAKKYKFFRSELPTVVWDGKLNKAIARFVDGQFVTTDLTVARKLEQMGYPLIPVSTKTPPNISRKVPIAVQIKTNELSEEEERRIHKQAAGGIKQPTKVIEQSQIISPPQMVAQ